MINRSLNPSNPSNFGYSIGTIYKKIGFTEEISGAHILRRTLATKLFDDGYRVENIAYYLGDTEDTIMKHYISPTKRIIEGGVVKNIVRLRK